MPFQIIRNDITKVHADAIVNTANPEPVFASGTDGAVYLAAGAEKLLAERKKIGHIAPGEIGVTPAFGLHARYIIHTVGPAWIDGGHGEFALLAACYRKSLLIARQLGCRSIAFPLISTGVYGFPKDRALDIALSQISTFLQDMQSEDEEMDVTLAVFDKKAFDLSAALVEDVREYIDENYVQTQHEQEYGGNAPEEEHLRRRLALWRSHGYGGNLPEGELPSGRGADLRPGELSENEQGGQAARRRRPFRLPWERKEPADGDLQQAYEADEAPAQPSFSASPGTMAQTPVEVSFPASLDSVAEPPGPYSVSGSRPASGGPAARKQESSDLPDFAAPVSYGSPAAPKDKPEASVPAGIRPASGGPAARKGASRPRSLEDVLSHVGETFQECLLRMIDERGFTDTQVYKRANINRKLFSKIRCNAAYTPRRRTAIALAIGLQLNMDETVDLLRKAGIALSPGSKFDLIISYCVENGIYDICRINAILFDYDQPMLGDAEQ